MANPIPNLFRVPELKEKILFTLFILLIYRFGAHITVPGVDVGILRQQFGALSGGILGIYDMFVGGGLSRATILALGIMPYISASIMFQLLAAVFPTVEKLQKEGEDGRAKLTQWTRYTTVVLSVIQGFSYAAFLNSTGAVRDPGFIFNLTTTVILTVGAIFVMWLGEQITEAGDRQRNVASDFLLHHRRFSGGGGEDVGVVHRRTDYDLRPGRSGVRSGGNYRGRGVDDDGGPEDSCADSAEGGRTRPDPRRTEELRSPSGQLRRRHADHFRSVLHRDAGDGRANFCGHTGGIPSM